jgi:hypothetical protein
VALALGLALGPARSWPPLTAQTWSTVMLLQPAKDDSLEPSHVLGAEFVKLKKPYVGKVYPATGPDEEQRHCFGGARGMHVWADDAVAFLDRSVRP